MIESLTRSYEIFGIKLKVQTNNRILNEFISACLHNFQIENTFHWDIDVFINFSNYKRIISFNNDKISCSCIGSGTFKETGRIKYTKNAIGVKIFNEFFITGDVLRATSHVTVQKALWSLRKIYTRRQAEWQYAMYLAREVIFYPFFYELARRGIATIHGSAISRDKRSVIFLGLNGCGKSNLAKYFLFRGAKLVADNFCLLGAKPVRLLAFPEVLRLEGLLPNLTGQSLKYLARAYGKRLYALSAESVEFESVPAAVFLVGYGPKAGLWRAEPEVFCQEALARNFFNGEGLWASPLCLLAEEGMPSTGEIEAKAMEALCFQAPAYYLTMPFDQGYEQQETKNLLQSVEEIWKER